MGAIARQVLQVKRKNSTNCNPPEARLTVVGSVACRSGPREVATGRAVASAGWVAGSVVGAAEVEVAATTGGSVAVAGGLVEAAPGAHAANITADRIRFGRMNKEILTQSPLQGKNPLREFV
jgi:hypothetical protein